MVWDTCFSLTALYMAKGYKLPDGDMKAGITNFLDLELKVNDSAMQIGHWHSYSAAPINLSP
jgi:hypothetical protein